MKVLLVSPHGKNLKGGIAQWTKDVWTHYNSTHSQVDLELLYFDNAKPGYATDSILSRLYKGCYNYLTLFKMFMVSVSNTHFDVVHICTSGSLTFVRDLLFVTAAKRKGIKVVLHTHFGRIPQVIESRSIEGFLLRRLMKCCDLFAVMDKRSERALKNAGCNVQYLPNPISQEVIDNGASLDTYREGATILFVGHIVPTKGVNELIDACKAIPQTELLLCGPIPDPIYEKEIKARANEQVHFLGAKPHEEIVPLMSKASIFALPSYTEGFPITILEAMASKCPIVTTDVGAIPEMLNIATNPCGICVPAQNAEQLTNALRYGLENKEEMSSLAQKAYERVSECYSVTKVWEQLVEIWENK